MQRWKRWGLTRRPAQPISQQTPQSAKSAGRRPAASAEEARLALLQLFAGWEVRAHHPLFTPLLPSGATGAQVPASPQDARPSLESALRQIQALGPLVSAPLIEVLRAQQGGALALQRAALAALTLGRLGAISATPALLEALGDQREGAAPLRQAAATALGQMQAEAAAHLFARPRSAPASDEWPVTVEAFRIFPSARVIAALAGALRDSSPAVRAASAAAFLELLVDAPPDGWLPPDTEPAAQPAEMPWLQAARAALPAALEPLAEALKDPDATVRLQAAAALGWIGNARAAGPLSGALGDPDARCRSAAALALGMLGTPDALKPLAWALADPSSAVRQSAAEALGQLANPIATDLLLDVLHNAEESLEVRAAVARALGKLHIPQVVSPLQSLLRAPEPLLRAAALEAFGSLGFGRAYRLLIPFLWRDPDRAARHSAARALARLGAVRARRTRWRLRLALRVDRQVRQEAIALLDWHASKHPSSS